MIMEKNAEPLPIMNVRKIKNVNLKGGVVFDGFQSLGLTNTIACGCFVNSLQTDLVAIIDSPIFPAISIIYNSTPNFPVRIYAHEEKKLAFFVSELTLDPIIHRTLADTLLDWTLEQQCDTIISIVGRPIEDPAEYNKDQSLHVVTNTKEGIRKLQTTNIKFLNNGTVSGIPGLLLNEGIWKNITVIVFVIDVISGVPDFRGAATVAEVIGKIIPGAYCDTARLIKEAEAVEHNLKIIRKQQANKELRDKMYG